MFFGGIDRISQTAFEGKSSAVLFTQGCNFFCPFCPAPHFVPLGQNIDPLSDAVLDPIAEFGIPGEPLPAYMNTELSEEKILAWLASQKSQVDAVVLGGGEPTLQASLLDFCREITRMGFVVKIETNGSRPDVLEGLLSADAVDCVSMHVHSAFSLYSPCLATVRGSRDVPLSVALLKQSAIQIEFVSAAVAPYVTPEVLVEMSKLLGKSTYRLQPVHIGKVGRPVGFEMTEEAGEEDLRLPRPLSPVEIASLCTIAKGRGMNCRS